MKQLFTLLVTLLLITVPVSGQDTINILYFNDSHSCLAPLAPRKADLSGTVGGAARLTTVIETNKMEDSNTIIASGGDSFFGDLTFNLSSGTAEFMLFNQLGVDMMTMGNHELDLEPSFLLQALTNSNAQFKLLSANSNLEAVPELKDYFAPYLIKQIGNKKIGFFGLTTNQLDFSQPAPIVVDAPFEYAANVVQTLSTEGCDLIICLSHLGRLMDSVLAINVPGINLIAGAHDHIAITTPVIWTDPDGKTVSWIQTEGFYKQVAKISYTFEEGGPILNYNLISLNESIPENSFMKSELDKFISQIEYFYGPLYTEKIGDATEFFNELTSGTIISENHSTSVGNFITDVYRQSTGTEIAIQMGGSTAQPIYKGPIVRADLYRTLGYGINAENGLGYYLTTFKIFGGYLKGLIKNCIEWSYYNDELMPQVSGMEIQYKLVNKSNIVKKLDIYVDGNVLNDAQEYTVTANQLVLMFLQNSEIPLSEVNFLPNTEFEVLVQYLDDTKIITPNNSQRIIDLKANNLKPLKTAVSSLISYPNPFNPSTTICFDLTQKQVVTLEIYNSIGQLVETLINKDMDPGRYEIKWNPENYSSGLYLCRLSTKEFQKSIKLMYLK